MADAAIRVERRGRVVRCTLDRPPLNLFEPGLIAALRATFVELAADPSVGLVVLTGAGRAFTAGMNVNILRDLEAPGAEALITSLHDAIDAVHIPIEEIEMRVEELNREDDIVVYCHQGVRSAAVAEFLRSLGFKSVQNLSGGLDLWARTVDQGMRRY